MLTSEDYENADFKSTHWFDDGNRVVLSAQHRKAEGVAIVSVGHPFALETLTEAEALAIAESFAPTFAVLLSDMRAELAKMRGGQ